MYVQRVAPVGDSKAAEAHGIGPRTNVAERHQVLAIGADIGHIVIDGAAIAIDRPLQRTARSFSRNRQAVVDAGLDLGTLFVIVPGYELQSRQLLS